jgi:hypothetical protein
MVQIMENILSITVIKKIKIIIFIYMIINLSAMYMKFALFYLQFISMKNYEIWIVLIGSPPLEQTA